MLQIADKFLTISKLAQLCGFPVYQIRFSGCNLNCHHCSKEVRDQILEYTSPVLMKQNILQEINDYPELAILFSGGEPLLNERQDSINQLMIEFHQINFYVHTNGSIPISRPDFDNIHYIAEWKSPSTGESESFMISNIHSLREELDSVITGIAYEDRDWLLSIIEDISDINPFLPVYVYELESNNENLGNWILQNRLPVRLSDYSPFDVYCKIKRI